MATTICVSNTGCMSHSGADLANAKTMELASRMRVMAFLGIMAIELQFTRGL